MQYKLTLALAANCTCGLAAAQLAPAEGVSDVLLGSVATCHARAKQKLLGVRADTLALYSADSQQTTNEIALGLRKHLPPADVGVTVTGLCGPGASAVPEKPTGIVFVPILLDGHAHEYRVQRPGAGADAMRQQAVASLYQSRTDLLGQRQATAPQIRPSPVAGRRVACGFISLFSPLRRALLCPLLPARCFCWLP